MFFGILAMLVALVILALVVGGFVLMLLALRGRRSNRRGRSPLPPGFRAQRRTRLLRWFGLALTVAVVGSLWAWFVRSPLPAQPVWF